MSFGAGDDEYERLTFFETALEQAKQDFRNNPKDALALTRWGGALLELAHFRQGAESLEMFQEAVGKFKQALSLEPKRHDTMWCLGNAYTSLGFISNQRAKARAYFDEAQECFKRAAREEPDNEVYKKALEMAAKAPELHEELQQELRRGGQGSFGGGMAAASKPSEGSAFWYALGGWVILGGLILAWTTITKPNPAAVPK